MSGLIHILDTNTANKIAAGEVVERPASIVKELVENAIDAQSKNIEIEIAEGGTSYIRVTDDGVGMSSDDAQKAVLRHATSKISSAEDLSSLVTLGFRGEALPSIAAVSKFTLTTRLHTESLASYVEIDGGVISDVREAGASVGTTVTIKDLFFNTPARRKFLKSFSAESSHIHDIIGKLALSHPNITFKLTNNQRLVLATQATDNVRDTLLSLYGQKIESEMLPVHYSDEDITVTGFIGKPTLIKSNRQWQTYIVNNRVIQSKLIMKALDNAYNSLLPKTGHPLALLDFKIDAHSLDVNVHPQKLEIKFSDEKKIFRATYRAITNALTSATSPQALATTIAAKQIHVSPPAVAYRSAEYYPRPQHIELISETQSEPTISFSQARNIIKEQQEYVPLHDLSLPAQEKSAKMYLQPLSQIDNLFIIAQGADGLYIIDQHAAHERILYDKFCRHTDRIPSQQLLVPVYLELTPQETDTITEKQTIFYDLGFTVDIVGPGTVRLLELPADIEEAQAKLLLLEILKLINDMKDPAAHELRHASLQMAACRAAIKAGQSLNMRQMQALIEELCATDLPYTCPHGRPAMVRISGDELAKMFKRT